MFTFFVHVCVIYGNEKRNVIVDAGGVIENKVDSVHDEDNYRPEHWNHGIYVDSKDIYKKINLSDTKQEIKSVLKDSLVQSHHDAVTNHRKNQQERQVLRQHEKEKTSFHKNHKFQEVLVPTIYQIEPVAEKWGKDTLEILKDTMRKFRGEIAMGFIAIIITSLAAILQRRGQLARVSELTYLGSMLYLIQYLPDSYFYFIMPPGVGNIYLFAELGLILVLSKIFLKEHFDPLIILGILFCFFGSCTSSMNEPSHTHKMGWSDLRILMFLVVLMMAVAVLCAMENVVHLSVNSEHTLQGMHAQKSYLPAMGALFMTISHICLVLIHSVAPYAPSDPSAAIHYYSHSPQAVGWSLVMLLSIIGNFSSVLLSSRLQELTDFYPRYFSYAIFLTVIQSWFFIEDFSQVFTWQLATSISGLFLSMIGCFIVDDALERKHQPKDFIPWERLLVQKKRFNPYQYYAIDAS